MSKKVIVISLGGSLIIPDKINFTFLDRFKKTLARHYSKYKFILVCGGGAIARKYIEALKEENKTEYELSQAGIRATRMNAMFIMQFFGKDGNSSLPLDMKEVKALKEKHNVVICGALRFVPHSTSDSTAARLAHYLRTDFINMTNVKGLFSADPKKDKKAKFIPKESWSDFKKRALKIKMKPGQHFVLDQKAAVIIKEHKITTYIIGSNLQNLDNLLKGKKFIGTEISDDK